MLGAISNNHLEGNVMRKRLSFLLTALFVLSVINANSMVGTTKNLQILNDSQPKMIFPADDVPIALNGNNEVGAFSSVGSGNSNDPYIIENVYIDMLNSGDNTSTSCVSIQNTDVHILLRNITVLGCSQGFYLTNVSHVALSDINVVSSTENGFWIGYSDHVTITNSRVSDSGVVGFFLSNNDEVTLIGNTAARSSFDGFLVETSERGIFTNNTSTNNTRNGFHLRWSDQQTLDNNTSSENGVSGFDFYETRYITVGNSTIMNNDYKGLNLQHSDYSVVADSLIKANAKYGLGLYGSSRFNLIERNQFLDNNLDAGDGQAYDETTNNTFQHNYWSDHASNGSYTIAGKANNTDSHPQEHVTTSAGGTSALVSSESTVSTSDTTSSVNLYHFAILSSLIALMVFRFRKRQG